MMTLDGSMGEGGGQILRTALGLSLVTGKSFRIVNIRGRRKKPGLLHQHLTSVRAAREIGKAQVEGVSLGASEISFQPGKVTPGIYHFAVETSGSTTLVLQTVLPPLLLASEPTTLVLEGGTHNPFAPPYDFLEKSFFPILNRMGPHLTLRLERAGFFPRGGGRMTVTIQPIGKLKGLEILERGPVLGRRARAVVSGLPRHIAERELKVIQAKLELKNEELEITELPESYGPGNVLLLEIQSNWLTEVVTGFGIRGVPAEQVAESVVREAQPYLSSDVPIGSRLADQLLLPFALAGEGSFRTFSLTEHATTNIEVLKQFLEIEIRVEKLSETQALVTFPQSRPSSSSP